jgi:hypothetical protein
VTLTCTSTTSGSLTYAWFKDGTSLSTTTSTEAIASFSTSSHAGSYACVVTLNGVDSVASAAVAVAAASK